MRILSSSSTFFSTSRLINRRIFLDIRLALLIRPALHIRLVGSRLGPALDAEACNTLRTLACTGTKCNYYSFIGHKAKVCNNAVSDRAAQFSTNPRSPKIACYSAMPAQSQSKQNCNTHQVKSDARTTVTNPLMLFSLLSGPGKFSVNSIALSKQIAMFVSVHVNNLSLDTGFDNSVLGSSV